ncbi:putative retrotransposon hot spot protein 4 (RHS4) [Trypanosoma vivax]|nr:putative retrotransposon hot spot protein 4 (RHS4) [Trypanosoma vivax]
MVRVWHVVEHQIRMWPNCTHQCTNEPYVLLGTPGIGKSLGCGSYLLYELLHYDAAEVPIVAYFVLAPRTSSTRPGAMAGQVVFYEEAKTAVSVMNKITADNMKSKKARG